MSRRISYSSVTIAQAEEKRKRLPVAERRALIVEAAGLLFGERGYDAVRLDEIAAASGVTKPILYRHFESKEDLYLALLERHRSDLPTFTGVMPSEGTLAERLRPVLDVWLSYVEQRAYSWQMLFRDSGGGEEIRAFREAVHDEARAVIADAVRGLSETPIPEREIEPLAELLSMGMASVVLWWTEGRGGDRDSVLDALVRIWVSLLGREPA